MGRDVYVYESPGYRFYADEPIEHGASMHFATLFETTREFVRLLPLGMLKSSGERGKPKVLMFGEDEAYYRSGGPRGSAGCYLPMKRLVLVRHAKSSWANIDLDDFARPLNARGKKDGPEMAARLARAGVHPDLIVASPAKRARKTALYMAKGTGYDKGAIRYYDELYLGSLAYHLQLLAELFGQAAVLFLVGHNPTITELAEHLTGKSLGNVPTCGVVAVEYAEQDGFTDRVGGGKLLFFDFPKNRTGLGAGT